MPNSITIALVVLGGVLVLIAVLGGRFKIWGADIEGSTGNVGRIIAGVLGVIFILIAIVMALIPSSPSTSQPQTVVTTSQPANTTTPPTSESTTNSATGYACSAQPNQVTLSTDWSNPIRSNGSQFQVKYDQGNLDIQNLTANSSIQVPIPDSQGNWINIPQTTFFVCADSNNNIYVYTP